MSQWTSGDTLDSATLNARGASASSVGGFSTNTLRVDSGESIVVPADTRLVMGALTPGADGVVQIGGSQTGSGRDGLSITPTLDGAGGPTGIYCAPNFSLSAQSQTISASGFGFSTISTNGFVADTYWAGLIYTPLAITGAGSVYSLFGHVYSDFTLGSGRNYPIYTNRGHLRFGDTSRFTSGTAIAPGIAFDSEVSLGFYRSGNSQVALSYGTLMASGLSTGDLRYDVRFAGPGINASILSIGLFGQAVADGNNLLALKATTATPTINPVGNGGYVFVRGGALLFLGGSGSLTTVAPA